MAPVWVRAGIPFPVLIPGHRAVLPDGASSHPASLCPHWAETPAATPGWCQTGVAALRVFFGLFAAKSCHPEQRRARRCAVPQFPWLQEQGQGSTAGCGKHREVFGAPDSLGGKGRAGQGGGLAASSPCPTFLGGRCWGRHREPGGDSVWGSHTRTRRCRGREGRELCKDSLLRIPAVRAGGQERPHRTKCCKENYYLGT